MEGRPVFGRPPAPKDDVPKRVLDLVLTERDYQRQRWTDEHDKKHTPTEWFAILTVYMGKLASETSPYKNDTPQSNIAFLKRLTQLTAIGLAAQEALLSRMVNVAPGEMEIEHSTMEKPIGRP